MHAVRPCLTLIAIALLAACQSPPQSAHHAPARDPLQARAEAQARAAEQAAQAAADAAAASAEAASDAAARGQALTLDSIAVPASENYAPPPPAPPAPMKMLASPSSQHVRAPYQMAILQEPAPPPNTERYAGRDDNPVHRASEQPVSTFSIDVDTGSYSNVRRMLRAGVRPPADAVRAEEFINYFDYGHPAPADRATPFRVSTELAPAPWNAQRQLLMIGIKGYDVPKATLPPANLVFLIDTSGSMESPDKLPLLKQSFAQLVPQLRAQDRVSIVVYAGSAGLVLPPTAGNRHAEILDALDHLQAGGSTNGGEGISLAYAMAKQAYLKDGVNRVILATDGDFNVGTVDTEALKTLVADQRKSGIALTTLGFGQGNYNDAMAEQLADVGDGNHAYIDTPQEARKVLVEEMQATLLTIARDVKIQVEFNPAVVAEYRLIGYENRLLKQEDFNNDKVDAGDIGAGHEVTALYEVTLVGSNAQRLPPLRYNAGSTPKGDTRELAHLALRYKRPGQDSSQLIETAIANAPETTRASDRFRFAASVAAYADLLRGGQNIDHWTWKDVRGYAQGSVGEDRFGLRREFVQLLDSAQRITGTDAGTPDVAVAR